MINIGIIGYGYWGPNLCRNFNLQQNAKLYAIAESKIERHKSIKDQFPSVKLYGSADEIINDNQVDAIVIATPVYSHFELAMKALKSGKHVMLEKPMTSNVKQAVKLIEVSENLGLVLMVDHTFLYTAAVQKIKEMIDSGVIGNLKYFDSTRINLGLFQSDVNVLWDLAPHDISIILHLLKERPFSVNATGISHLNNGIEDLAYLTLNYNNNMIAHFNCSWTSPVKVRQILVGGDKKMILYNDIEPTEKLKVYDTSYAVSNDEEKFKFLIDYRQGDILIPKISNHEALFMVAKDFVASIVDSQRPLSDSHLGFEVVKILEAAEKSIKNNGKEIKL